jgi:hypothetical protein
MKAGIGLLVPALVLAAAAGFILARTPAQAVTEAGEWRRDLTLLDPRTNTHGSGEVILQSEPRTLTFSEALLATNHPVLRLGEKGRAPVTCEISVPCRVVIQSSKSGQDLQFSVTRFTYIGGVKVGVFIQEHLAFELTADEVKVEK